MTFRLRVLLAIILGCIAGWLCYSEIQGWGWFLFVAALAIPTYYSD